VSADEAARFLKVTGFRFRQLVADGFITPANRKGFYRLGVVLDGFTGYARTQLPEETPRHAA